MLPTIALLKLVPVAFIYTLPQNHSSVLRESADFFPQVLNCLILVIFLLFWNQFTRLFFTTSHELPQIEHSLPYLFLIITPFLLQKQPPLPVLNLQNGILQCVLLHVTTFSQLCLRHSSMCECGRSLFTSLAYDGCTTIHACILQINTLFSVLGSCGRCCFEHSHVHVFGGS